MELTSILLLSFGVLTALLWLSWIPEIGLLRSTLSALCRVGWVAPLLLAFAPEVEYEQLPNSLTLKPVHVLVDDSQSMKDQWPDESQRIIERLRDDCRRLGCSPKITFLSQRDDRTEEGFTPLSATFESWLFQLGRDPWILVSDGGDYLPRASWSRGVRGLGGPQDNPRGHILGLRNQKDKNIWISQIDNPPFFFETKPQVVSVTLKRQGQSLGPERVQVQMGTLDEVMATANASFEEGATEASVTASIPALPKGQHLLSVKALPTPEENVLWDNLAYGHSEVLPNTVGVLHLLGSPSWDGRFLRRYLKGEPKYDLISFFILRDPWDTQAVSERELSLIPFPVERLFREELPNFRVVILQNFALFQFLLPEFQRNLVQFVKDGGGLLFLGGPRSLQSGDLSSSPLKDILPFEVSGLSSVPVSGRFLMRGMGRGSPAEVGPYYDEQLPFRVEFSKPETHKRQLATLYDEWEALSDELTQFKAGIGHHRMDKVRFKENLHTPMLTAVTPKGDRIPMAVASYPENGRAVWVFTDSLWRLAMDPNPQISRQIYQQLINSTMTWLLRSDMRKPLVIKDFHVRIHTASKSQWFASVQGPAARYFSDSKDWQVNVCGANLKGSSIVVERSGTDTLSLRGDLPVNVAGGQRCDLSIAGKHVAFGSVKAAVATVVPELFADIDMRQSPQKLQQLANLTNARLTFVEDDLTAMSDWIGSITGTEGIALPNRIKTSENHFWVLGKPWFFLLLLLLPLEVVIRRWHRLGHRQRLRAPPKTQLT